MVSEAGRGGPYSELQPAASLQAYGLQAVDGDVGGVEDLYFDSVAWTVRYLVVNTGSWLLGRRVLISPVAVGRLIERDNVLHIELTRDQIRNSPPLGDDRPVSKGYEMQYYQYYGWPPYWSSCSPLSLPSRTPGTSRTQQPTSDQTRLRSSAHLLGYSVTGDDAGIGRVDGFIIDMRYWTIRYLEVGTSPWRPGGHVLISPAWIASLDGPGRELRVDISRAAVQAAPAYTHGEPIERAYESRLFRHYRRAPYWQSTAPF